MFDILIYVNLFLAIVAMVFEIIALFRRPEYIFAQMVGILGFLFLACAYVAVIFNVVPGMPTFFTRSGILFILAYWVSSNLYAIYRR